ncbi:MAG: superoxide dismutase, Fe-Mn family [Clostridiales bacterium]|jgi:Fe-Mn family superoxide dismutase|nr:superoxide dismutase, Fe-Mn family [Clostridiales bacterium]MDN5297871.1 superoxide dismutase, Fe-Mn family [Clostridiales bacterium]
MKFVLPTLNYAYDALEPHIDAKTMEVHHSKHHAGYTNNLNAALEAYPALQDKTIESLLQELDQLPEAIRGAVRNNGGGYYNHKLFWEMISPSGGGTPKGALMDAINRDFGSFDRFKETFKAAALKQFGSGWAWLIADDGKLKVVSTPNQDSPVSEGKSIILGVDVWEHAYYLKYQNRRAEYLDAFFEVVDWDKAASKF